MCRKNVQTNQSSSERTMARNMTRKKAETNQNDRAMMKPYENHICHNSQKYTETLIRNPFILSVEHVNRLGETINRPRRLARACSLHAIMLTLAN